MFTFTAQYLSAAPAMLPSLTIIDATGSLIEQVVALLLKFAAGAAIGFLVYKVFKSKFGIGSIVGAGLAAGAFLFFVLGGAQWIQGLIDNQSKNLAIGPEISQVLVLEADPNQSLMQ